LWELTSARFTKQVKAGANAGQPSALSALISLYLGQAVVAAEDEIESFLSPLASRSRVRDVIHALLSARQLETVAVEGRTMLYVAGSLPAFLAAETAVVVADVPAEGMIAIDGEPAEGTEDAAGGEEQPRIKKYVPKPRKVGTGYLAKAKPSKFAAKPGPFERGTKSSSRPGFKDRARSGFDGPTPERERRPFGKPAAGGFDKPWDEEKAKRLAAARKPSEPAEDGAEARAPRAFKPRTEGGDRGKFGGKAPYRGKPSFGDKPAFRGKPSFGEGRPPRGEFKPRREGDAGEARGPRKTFSKPGTFGRKREGGFGARESGEGRPPRREFKPREGQGGERRPRFDRGEGGGFAARKPYPPRGAGFFSGKPRAADGPSAGGPRERPDRGAAGEGSKRVYKKFDAPRDRPSRPYSSDRPARGDRDASKRGDFAPRKFAGKAGPKAGGKPGGFGPKKVGGFADKKSGGFGKKSDTPFKGKPTSTFAKFAGNKKPWGKRPPARKFKPNEGDSE
jgi:hypothetical protein